MTEMTVMTVFKGMGYKVISVTNAVSTGLFIGGTINV